MTQRLPSGTVMGKVSQVTCADNSHCGRNIVLWRRRLRRIHPRQWDYYSEHIFREDSLPLPIGLHLRMSCYRQVPVSWRTSMASKQPVLWSKFPLFSIAARG